MAALATTDQTRYKAREAPVAQLDRALPSEGRGQRFESSRVRHDFCGLRSELSSILQR